MDPLLRADESNLVTKTRLRKIPVRWVVILQIL